MPRISGESLEEHRAALRRSVFEAFAALVGEQGFDTITMAGLAQRAGIGRTAIYHHFRDKEAVMVAFASDETARYLEQLQAALDGVEDPANRLRVYLRHQLEAGKQFHMGFGVQVYGRLSLESRLAIREHVRAVEDVLRAILDDGVAAGRFRIEDTDGTMSLIHACLSPRHLPAGTIETFVLRAVGAAG